jgi:Na+/H+ antiporter NhaC
LVIDVASPWMSRAMLPAVAFAALAPLTVATGSFWGVYAIATPILVPLAISLDVYPPLAVGAMVSAGAFGSHACFYGDATVLSSAASGCNNMAHAVTQLPYALLAATVTTIIYLALGFMM